MKRILKRRTMCVMTLFAFAVWPGMLIAEGDAEGLSWLTGLPEAQSQAKQKGLPILANFTGSDWCHWCTKLKEEVFDTEEFRSWADANVVLLEVDFPRNTRQDPETRRQNERLKQSFTVRGYPTIVFVDKDLNELGRIAGYENLQTWMKHARKIVSKKG